MTDTSATLSGKELAALSRRSDARGARQLILHLALLCLTGYGVYSAAHDPKGDHWLVPAMVVHGIVLIFLFTAEHECVHRTAFKSRFANRWVANFTGFLVVLPPKFFTAFHFEHHRFTQDPEKDPELRTLKPRNWGEFIYIVSGINYWQRSFQGLINHSMGRVDEDYVQEKYHEEIVKEARRFIIGYVALAGLSYAYQNDFLLTYWVLPALLGQPFLRLYLFAEHWGCPTVSDMWANSRTIFSNPIVRFLAWNMPYHIEHHAHPSVPFHALPKVAKLAGKTREVTSPGYIHFCFKEIPGLVEKGDGM